MRFCSVLQSYHVLARSHLCTTRLAAAASNTMLAVGVQLPPYRWCQRQAAPTAARTRTIASGILDSYRREKGLAAPDQPATATMQQPVSQIVDEPPCPVECVKELRSGAELDTFLSSVSSDTVVVLDLYKTSCGACKYIAPGFVKLCRASAEDNPLVAFLKHNIQDDEFELTDIANRFEVKGVPLFLFFKGGQVIERFNTREKQKVAEAINRHTGRDLVDV